MRATLILLCLLPAIAAAQELPRAELDAYIAKARPRVVELLKREIKNTDAELKKARGEKILAVRDRLAAVKAELVAVQAVGWMPTLDIAELAADDVGIPRRLDKETGKWKDASLRFKVEMILDDERAIIYEEHQQPRFLLHRKTSDLKAPPGRFVTDFPVKVGEQFIFAERGMNLQVREMWIFADK